MKKLFFAIALLCSVSASAQALSSFPAFDSQQPQEQTITVILPKGTSVKQTKTTIHIVTSDKDVAIGLLNAADGYVKSYTVRSKKDRNGQYVEYSISLQPEVKNCVIKYFSHLTAKN